MHAPAEFTGAFFKNIFRDKTFYVFHVLPAKQRSLNPGLSLEGKTVGALNDRGVSLVCADFNLVERAIIFTAAVVFTVVDSASDVLVCIFSSHNDSP